VFPWEFVELWCTRATAFVYDSFPSYPVVFCEALVPVHPSGVCILSCTCASACFELALLSLCNQQSSVINMWVDPSCVTSSTILHSSLASGLLVPHPWFYCSWCSPLAFAHFLVGFFLLLCSYENSSWVLCKQLFTMLDLTHLTSQPSLEASSSFVTSALSVPTPRLLYCFQSTISLGLFSGFRRIIYFFNLLNLNIEIKWRWWWLWIIFLTRSGFARWHALDKLLQRREHFLGHMLSWTSCLGPLFLFQDGLLPSRCRLSSLLQSTIQAAGAPRKFSRNSLRIGAATTVAQKSLSGHLIRTLGRWSSNVYLLYVCNLVETILLVTARLS